MVEGEEEEAGEEAEGEEGEEGEGDVGEGGGSSPTARGGGATDWVGSNGLTPPSPLPRPSALPPPGGAAEPPGGSSRGGSPTVTPDAAERADERV